MRSRCLITTPRCSVRVSDGSGSSPSVRAPATAVSSAPTLTACKTSARPASSASLCRAARRAAAAAAPGAPPPPLAAPSRQPAAAADLARSRGAARHVDGGAGHVVGQSVRMAWHGMCTQRGSTAVELGTSGRRSSPRRAGAARMQCLVLVLQAQLACMYGGIGLSMLHSHPSRPILNGARDCCCAAYSLGMRCLHARRSRALSLSGTARHACLRKGGGALAPRHRFACTSILGYACHTRMDMDKWANRHGHGHGLLLRSHRALSHIAYSGRQRTRAVP